MPEPVVQPTPMTAERSPWLRGPVRVPGDLLVSNLALILAAMARGESIIENLSIGPSTAATVRVLGQLGVPISESAGRWHVQGLGIGGFLTPEAPLDLTGAGSATPLLVNLIAAHDFESRFSGLSMSPEIITTLDFLARNGTFVDHTSSDITVRGPRFAIPLDLALPAEASYLRAPLLLAASVITGASTLHTAAPEADPTESLLAIFGARITGASDDSGRTTEIEGMSPLRAQAVVVPGDPTLAAYPAVAALIAPDSEITVEGLSLDRDRFGMIDALLLLGADIALTNVRPGGKPTVDLAVRHSPLSGAIIPASLAIEAEDFAILAIAAAFAEGETVFEGLGEGSRRFALTRALRDNGIECEERAGGLAVHGMPRVPGGGNIVTRLDPKLAMSFLVLGMAADQPVTIDDGAVMTGQFPNFVPAFEHIGASFKSGAA